MTSTESESLLHTPGHVKHDGHNLTGFIIFLCSESIIFFAFFVGYGVLKITAPTWYPDGVTGIAVREPLINTVILVSSSFVIYFAFLFDHLLGFSSKLQLWLSFLMLKLHRKV